MNTGAIIAIVVSTILASTCVVLLARRRGRDSAELREAKKRLRSLERQHGDAVKSAEKQLNAAERNYARSLKAAEKDLASARDTKGKLVGGFGGIRLYEMHIATPHGSGSLAGVTATVESETSRRLTATRMLALGVFSLAVPKKTGEVYLTIDGPEFVSMVKSKPDQSGRAREFALKINNAAKGSAAKIAARPGIIASAEKRRDDATAATGPIEASKREVAQAANNTDRLDAIRAARAEVSALDPASGGLRALEVVVNGDD